MKVFFICHLAVGNYLYFMSHHPRFQIPQLRKCDPCLSHHGASGCVLKYPQAFVPIFVLLDIIVFAPTVHRASDYPQQIPSRSRLRIRMYSSQISHPQSLLDSPDNSPNPMQLGSTIYTRNPPHLRAQSDHSRHNPRIIVFHTILRFLQLFHNIFIHAA